MNTEQLFLIEIAAGGIILAAWLMRIFVSLIKKGAASISKEEMEGQILQQQLNDPNAQIRHIGKMTRRKAGPIRWMARIIAILLILDAFFLSSAGLWIIIYQISNLLSSHPGTPVFSAF